MAKTPEQARGRWKEYFATQQCGSYASIEDLRRRNFELQVARRPRRHAITLDINNAPTLNDTIDMCAKGARGQQAWKL